MFADVIIQVPLHKFFTYAVPEYMQGDICMGSAVQVPFGKNGTCTAFVYKLHFTAPEEYKVKSITALLDQGKPRILPLQIQLLEWISSYYICSLSDALKAAMPGVLRPHIGRCDDKVFKAKTAYYIFSADHVNLEKELENTKFPQRQREVLERFIKLSSYHEGKMEKPVPRRSLTGVENRASALKSLMEKGLLSMKACETGRLPKYDGEIIEPHTLSETQSEALGEIKNFFLSKRVVLLHGATSSGKTEIYIHLIKEQLERGGQVLYLLPEIALTTQIMWRLQLVFGNSMCVYNSRLSSQVRAEIWNRQLGENPYTLVLGARSALFLPFQHLGLVIVDEEHDTSYKQESPAPRYNARACSIMLATLAGAHVLLGSATPAVESFSNALQGKYGMVTLKERFGKVSAPEIEIVDITELKRKKLMKGIFSPQLVSYINEALSGKKQVILFHNRRGFHTVVECGECGWTQKCCQCAVPLTYHKIKGKSECHYCSRSYPLPKECPECGSTELLGAGLGTEKIEERIQKVFPQARVARLDYDTTTGKGDYERILQDFADGETDILVGTQMLSKGLDFSRVSVVGILQADSLFSFPDFRSAERAFQTICQVSGRAGRRDGKGRVVVQTKNAGLTTISTIKESEYESLFITEMQERKKFSYPPYVRLTVITLKDTNENRASTASLMLASRLNTHLTHATVLGPDTPPVAYIKSFHIRRILVKAPLSGYEETNRILLQEASFIRKIKEYSTTVIHFDVDPSC